MLVTLIFATIATICCTVIYTQIRALMAANNPYSRRLLYAADMRTAIEITGDAELDALRRRDAPTFMKFVVDRLKLTQWLGTEGLRDRLMKAGYRFKGAEVIYLFARFAFPITLLTLVAVYSIVANGSQSSGFMDIAIATFAIFAGLQIPDQFLKGKIKGRRQVINEAWPDALDLMQIAVESGMTIDKSIHYVADKLEVSAPPLADELMLLLTHVMVMPDRRAALLAFSKRIELDSIRNYSTVLIQAEKSGTPIGKALRTLSNESRKVRLRNAESRASQLGPKMTIPLIICFVPVLLLLLGMPAYITAMH